MSVAERHNTSKAAARAPSICSNRPSSAEMRSGNFWPILGTGHLEEGAKNESIVKIERDRSMREYARIYGAIGSNNSHDILPLVIVRKLASGTATHSASRLFNGSETIARASLENRPASGAISIVASRFAL